MKPPKLYERKPGGIPFHIREPEIAEFIDKLLGDPLSISEILNKVNAAFGGDRSPSRSALHRYIKKRTEELENHGPDSSAGEVAKSEAEWRFLIVRSVIRHPKKSKERSAEIKRVCRRTYIDHKGRERALAPAQIRNWAHTFENSNVTRLNDV